DEKKAETARILNNWVQSFIRTGKPEGLPQYRAQSEEDRRTVMVYNLETGEQTIEKGTLDYLYPAYPMNLEEMGFERTNKVSRSCECESSSTIHGENTPGVASIAVIAFAISTHS